MSDNELTTMKQRPIERLHLSKVYLQRQLPLRDPHEDVYESLPSLTDVDGPKQPDYTKNVPGVPPEALPVVMTLPLDSRMPVLKGPKGKNTLYTTYVGETYYKRPGEQVDFDLTDLEGNFYNLRNDYNLLTDVHLKPFLRQHHIRDNLTDRGLLTDDGRVIVNVKDYNEFRRYLRHYNTAISKKADDLARAYDREMNPVVSPAQRMAMEQADNYRKRNEQAKTVRERIAQQRADRVLMYVKKAKEQDRRLKRIQERDMDEALEKEAMNRLIEEKRRQVIRRNELEERKRQMQTIKYWIESEQMREHKRKEREKAEAEAKAIKLRESWESHLTHQQDLLEREAQRRRELEEERRRHVHYRDIAFHRRRQQQQGSFQKIAEARRRHRKRIDEQYLRNYNNRIQEMRTNAARKSEYTLYRQQFRV
ncbi:hypothetical protein NP493_486g02056 [Ridgeia piscesae]|uniref:Fibrous sheath-interacting protein 2 n=1 Tax=Ridgeia piscesae TaxID=27915 RepID=A0AAD9NRB9_RIDPI|nr:hypothetical protein NP493_486g02056 [Ridgeia piscesae]